MPYYEHVFIARQDITSGQVHGLVDTLTELLQSNGGDVKKKEYWGLRTLAYRIRKNRKGHYVLLNLDAPADAVKELERNLRINEDVLRYLTVKVAELNEEPSPIMQGRAAREERSRDGGRDGGRDGRGRGPRSNGPDDRSGDKSDAKRDDGEEKPKKAAEAEPKETAEAEPKEAAEKDESKDNADEGDKT